MSNPAELDHIEIPHQIAPYVRALGIEGAVRFFIAFGGAPAYVASNPETRSLMREVIGEEGIRALAREIDGRIARVPLAKKWIARIRFAQNCSILAIARELHVADKTVRGWLKEERAERAEQLGLPL